MSEFKRANAFGTEDYQGQPGERFETEKGGEVNKDIKKNREALIRHFYSLPEPEKRGSSLMCSGNCVKMEALFKFTGKNDFEYSFELAPILEPFIAMTTFQIVEMQSRFEGWQSFTIRL